MASKNITIRLDEQQAEQLKKNYGQISTAAQLILEPHERLRKTAMAELQGYFTREELTALVDSQNGTMLTPDFIYNKTFFLAQLEDFEQLENGISRHGADADALMDKVRNLNSGVVYLLVMDIMTFWQAGNNFDDFINTLCLDEETK